MRKRTLREIAARVIEGKFSIAEYYTLAAARFVKTATAEALLIKIRAERKGTS